MSKERANHTNLPIPPPNRRLQSDPGHSSGWRSEKIWRWLTPSERGRVLALGQHLSVFEGPARLRRRS